MRYELSDYEWTNIKLMLPNKPRGVRRVNDRRVLNGIFWVLPDQGTHWRGPEARHGERCEVRAQAKALGIPAPGSHQAPRRWRNPCRDRQERCCRRFDDLTAGVADRLGLLARRSQS
jgi:transposase